MSKKAPKGTHTAASRGRKGKKAKGRAGADGALAMSVAAHPRARVHVRQAKAWGGLSAFAATAYLSLSHGVAPDAAGLRALAAGAGGYVVAWGASVMVWRHLMIAELRAKVEQARRRLDAEAALEADQAASAS